MPFELIIPIGLLLVGFVGYCWYDLAKISHTRFLPKWAWALICVITIPLGGLLYLLLGRGQESVAN